LRRGTARLSESESKVCESRRRFIGRLPRNAERNRLTASSPPRPRPPPTPNQSQAFRRFNLGEGVARLLDSLSFLATFWRPFGDLLATFRVASLPALHCDRGEEKSKKKKKKKTTEPLASTCPGASQIRSPARSLFSHPVGWSDLFSANSWGNGGKRLSVKL
jgi:hypothetical protein